MVKWFGYTWILLVFSGVLLAKDLGVHAQVFPIQEQDILLVIQARLQRLEGTGAFKKHNKQMVSQAKKSLQRPKGIDLPRALKTRVFEMDPSVVVHEDIKDHHGNLIHARGTRINPLDKVFLPQALLFFSADDPYQRAWAQKTRSQLNSKLILTKGEPLKLSNKWNEPVYFDQQAYLVKKLGITHLPAKVVQRGKRLQVTEVALKAKR